jgi:hypothetical protein
MEMGKISAGSRKWDETKLFISVKTIGRTQPTPRKSE